MAIYEQRNLHVAIANGDIRVARKSPLNVCHHTQWQHTRVDKPRTMCPKPINPPLSGPKKKKSTPFFKGKNCN